MFEGMTFMEIFKLVLPVIILQGILAVVSIVSLVRSERVRFLPKWVWAIIVVLINTVGPILYLTIGREKEV